MKCYHSAILKNVECYHATGPYYNQPYEETYKYKMKEWNKSDVDFHQIKMRFYYAIWLIRMKMLSFFNDDHI